MGFLRPGRKGMRGIVESLCIGIAIGILLDRYLFASACTTDQRHRRAGPAQSRCRRRTATGPRPANGTSTWPTSPAWPKSNARATSPEFLRPARRTAKSFARPILRILTWLSWPEAPAPFFQIEPRFRRSMAGHRPIHRRRPDCWRGGRPVSPMRANNSRTTTPPCCLIQAAGSSAATTRSTSSRSANSFLTRTCCSSPTNSPAAWANSTAEPIALHSRFGDGRKAPSLRRFHLLRSRVC